MIFQIKKNYKLNDWISQWYWSRFLSVSCVCSSSVPWWQRCIYSRITFRRPQKIKLASVASLHCTNPAPEMLQLTLYKPQTNMWGHKASGDGVIMCRLHSSTKNSFFKNIQSKSNSPINTPSDHHVSWTQKWRKLHFLLAIVCWCSNIFKRSIERLKKSNSD